MVLENVSLPYYTEKEDKANSISHLVGVIFGAAATAVLLTRSHDKIGRASCRERV